MPAWARESVSLIALLLAAVRSSSSLTRSRIGSVWRCTYFLRAKGLTRPQKPSREGGARGALPVAVSVEVVAAGAVELGDEDGEFCATAGSASTAANGRATNRRLFIITFLQKLGSVWAGLDLLNLAPARLLHPAHSLVCVREI